MAQHDYVISNGTGAAVRSDLNNALLAIVSNNSGATAPSPTYAYQLWADTTTNTLKLRNGANSSFITVGDLTAANLGLATVASPTFTGTATIPTLTVSSAANIPLGSAGSPTLYFTGDSNTGLYSPGADQVAISTGGSGRLFINSSGYTSIGNSSPQALVHFGAGTSAPAFGTASNLLYGCTAGQTEVQLRTTVNDVTGSIYTDSNGVNVRAASAHPLSFHTSNTERLRITSAGLVGIGSTAPNAKLTITETANANAIVVRNADTNGSVLQFGINTSIPAAYIQSTKDGSGTAQPLAFYGATSEMARFDTSSRFLLGTSTATQSSGGTSYTPRFVVYAGNEAGFYSRVSTTGAANVINNEIGSGTRYLLAFDCGATRVGDITSNGTTTSYGTTSDYRLKENVAAVTDGISRLQQLKPSRFNFIADPDKTVDGFIAHEVQAVVPEAVIGEKDAVNDDGNPIYQGIDQSKLVPLLTAALQEAIGEIESLKARVDALESA